MNNQKTLLISLLVTALAIGLVETDVIKFNTQGIHAQIDKTKSASIKFFGTPTQTSFNNLVLKNNIDGEVIVVQPDALIMIDNQDIKFQFKAYNPNENTIIVKKGTNLQLEYKLSEIDILKLYTVEKSNHTTRLITIAPQNIFGGIAGGLIGWNVGIGAEFNFEETMGSCMLGMLAGPLVLKGLKSAQNYAQVQSSDSWKEIHLDQWSVWSKE